MTRRTFGTPDGTVNDATPPSVEAVDHFFWNLETVMAESQIEALAGRVERLEREVLRTDRASRISRSVAAIAAMGALLLAIATFIWIASPTVAAIAAMGALLLAIATFIWLASSSVGSRVHDGGRLVQLTAKTLTLQDEMGSTQINGWGPRILMQGDQGKVLLTISIGTVLSLGDGNGVTRIMMLAKADGGVELSLQDTQSRARASLSVETDGAPSLRFFDEVGNIDFQIPPSQGPHQCNTESIASG